MNVTIFVIFAWVMVKIGITFLKAIWQQID